MRLRWRCTILNGFITNHPNSLQINLDIIFLALKITAVTMVRSKCATHGKNEAIMIAEISFSALLATTNHTVEDH